MDEILFRRGGQPLDGSDHALAGKLAGAGGYATLDAGVVSIRRRDGKILLEMTHETWGRLGRPRDGAGAP